MTNAENPLRHELDNNLRQSPKQLCRVFHGRGRFFPSLEKLNIEWYPPVLFVQCYEDQLSEEDSAVLKQLFDEHQIIQSILLQSRAWPDLANEILFSRDREHAELPLEFTASLDADLVCKVSLGENRNTGVFPDMRSGWTWVREHASDKRVLNLFSYTSVFSLFALRGGAKKVVNIDMCGSATKTAQANHQLNNLLDERVSIWKKNILKSNSQIAKQSKFDLIILDPPPFHKGSFKGWSDYQKLLRRSTKYLKEGGLILAALNNQQVSFAEFARDIETTIETLKSVSQLALSDEIKELEPDKGLKLALIET